MTKKERKYRLKIIAECHLDKRKQRTLELKHKSFSYKELYFMCDRPESETYKYGNLLTGSNAMSEELCNFQQYRAAASRVGISLRDAADAFVRLARTAACHAADLEQFEGAKRM